MPALGPDEMPGVGCHLSIQDSAPHLVRHPEMRLGYTHLNNTNPLVSDPISHPVASDGQRH